MIEAGTREAVENLAAEVGNLTTLVDQLEAGRVANLGYIEQLVTYGRRNRRLIRLLVATCMFDVILSVVLGLVGWKAFGAATEAKEATSQAVVVRNQAKVQCESGNEFRRLDRARWQAVIDLTAGRPQTDQQKADTARFLDIIDRADALRDCSTIQ